jgi:hypothetical protein
MSVSKLDELVQSDSSRKQPERRQSPHLNYPGSGEGEGQQDPIHQIARLQGTPLAPTC